MVFHLVVFDAFALQALQSLLHLIAESICWVLVSFLLLLVDLEFLKQIGEVLSGVLLLTCAELLMTFTDQ
jgi:hypothetical protein